MWIGGGVDKKKRKKGKQEGGRKGKEKLKCFLSSQSREKPTLKTPDTWYMFNKYLWLNSVTWYFSNFYFKKNGCESLKVL